MDTLLDGLLTEFHPQQGSSRGRIAVAATVRPRDERAQDHFFTTVVGTMLALMLLAVSWSFII